jgi:aspartate carbamoyltransferase regulatory subunit
MEKSIANITININYDSLSIKNKKLIKMKKLPKNAEVSALALISKYLNS